MRNRWVQMALQDPHSEKIHIFANDEFQVYDPEVQSLPIVKSSPEWYRGWRRHLTYAEIDSTFPAGNGEELATR